MLPSRERKLHVLVVEDNPGDVRLLEEAIRSFYSDAEVLVAYDGEQALRFIGELQFKAAIIFLDLNIPKLDGFEILGRQNTEVPTVILTSSVNPADKIRSLKLGAKDYIVKPLDISLYFTAIHGALAKWADVNSIGKSATS